MFKLNWGKLVFSTLFILAISVVFISQSNRAEAQSWFSGAATTGYRATIGIGQITLWDSTCQKINNANASLNYFVPTKSSLEWTAFSAVASIFSLSITSCTPTSCSPGYYVSTVCTICPAGSYCTGEVAISGTCAAGYYCPAGSSSAAQNACAAGTANPSTGQSAVGACTTCAAGTYNSGTGNTGCSACGCGYYCTGGTARAACGANYYYAGANGTGSGNCVYCGDNYTSGAGSCASGNCAIRTCAASATNGYSYPNINYTASVGVSKAVANGTCSATASCSAGTVSVTGENSSCNSGWYNNDGACSNGCESKCGDGVCNNGETTGTCPGDCGCSPGATRTMYAALTNSCGTYSASEFQTCQANYIFNGTYTLASAPSPTTGTGYAAQTTTCGTYGSTSGSRNCLSTGWNTATYPLDSAPSASTRTGYTSSSVACGSTCTTQTQTCTSGGWNGTGIGSCSASACGCTPGSTRTMYQSGTAACGTYCDSETQTCQTNGTWNGSYTSASDCSASASTRTVYSVQNVPCGSDCNGGNYYRTASCLSVGYFAPIGGYTYTSCYMLTNTCSAGTYCSGSCLSCGSGTYSNAGATSCTTCPAYTVNYGGGAGIDSCGCINYYNNTNYLQYTSYDCNNTKTDGCEEISICDPMGFSCPPPWQGMCGYCGDGYCYNGGWPPQETVSNCWNDCNTCGNGICDASETSSNCSADCVYYEYCGNGTCGDQETYDSCSSDCPYDCPSAFKYTMCNAYSYCWWNSMNYSCEYRWEGLQQA